MFTAAYRRRLTSIHPPPPAVRLHWAGLGRQQTRCRYRTVSPELRLQRSDSSRQTAAGVLGCVAAARREGCGECGCEQRGDSVSRRGRGGFLTMFLSFCFIWTQLLVAENAAGGLLPTSRPGRFPLALYPQHDVDDLPEFRAHHRHHHHHNHHQNPSWVSGVIPGSLSGSEFHQEPSSHRNLNRLLQPHHGIQPEHVAVSAQHLVTMHLAVDVRKLNVGLLRWFREGVAAALGVLVKYVHIQQLNEEKNGIELFVSSDRLGASEPRSAEEVIQSLNVRVLHRYLGHFGITEVSSEKNILQGKQKDPVWSGEGFYALFLFFTVFIIVITCLMVLYRIKEKVSEKHLKAPPPDFHLNPPIPPDPVRRSKGIKVVTSESMVQSEPPPAVATPIHQQQPIVACRHLTPPLVPLPSPAPLPIINSDDHAPPVSVAQVTTSNELRPCPSPFRMKPAAGLQERRGSNVSLVLDMSALGSVEPLNVTVVTPRETAAREYLLSAGRPLTRQQLQDVVNDTHKLHAEFAEIPMNFIDPKELDIPNYGTKNRYKTILPNPHSRVILKSRSSNDPLSSYINANYIRGYLGDSRMFIATQGPMVNTVNDFWQMAWQEEAPVIVMITKLKEKNEKCVLYWPEKRGIYGKVEVTVNAVGESEHYTTHSLTLKCGNQTRVLQHYWYTSWPDHKTPDSALPLLQLMSDVEADRRAAAALGPVIVHCSAGIGRTGCFIATTIGCRQLQVEGVVDILSITCQLRADRGGMIQTGEQYEFVHHALSMYETRLSTETGQ
ncbi:receptor type R [Nothobranchius furzeri]|uniref:protein-tyrosine-phosphatase n=2 Tax=Nothobranchius furzeri TaxID=105023 RepID=A0A9D2YYR3_NOTFU|nr:receptor type R [Nothobranchius furzeri]